MPMRFIFSFKIILLFLFTCQSVNKPVSLADSFFKKYENYKEQTFKEKRFKLNDILPLIEKSKSKDLSVKEIGRSFENRPIFELTYGSGPIKIMLWSQMHGDEPTATMALFDIFNFLNASGDEFDGFRKDLKKKATLYFIPMLNPDGAEYFQRRTRQEIDMNRDALRLVCPESRLLKDLQFKYKPDYSFNLHDMNPRVLVGNTDKQATIGFLASSADPEKTVSLTRKRAMQVIAHMNRNLQKYIPGQVSKYDDEHEPRAFGDNIQKWGSSLILIEAGGYKNDPDKMFIRKLNYVGMLDAFECIIKGTYKSISTKEYENIPQNTYKVYDIIVKNVTIKNGNTSYKIDIGINRTEVVSEENGVKSKYIRTNVMETGDLSIFTGFEIWDAGGAYLSDKDGLPVTINVGQIANLHFWNENKLVKSLQDGNFK